MAGMLAYRAYASRPSPPRWILPACLAGLMAVYLASRWASEGWSLDMLRTFAYTPFIAPAILLICLQRPHLLESEPVVWTGEISYSVYCLQFGAFIVLSPHIDKGWWFAVVSIAAVTVAAIPSYWLIERPARRLLRAYLTRSANTRQFTSATSA